MPPAPPGSGLDVPTQSHLQSHARQTYHTIVAQQRNTTYGTALLPLLLPTHSTSPLPCSSYQSQSTVPVSESQAHKAVRSLVLYARTYVGIARLVASVRLLWDVQQHCTTRVEWSLDDRSMIESGPIEIIQTLPRLLVAVGLTPRFCSEQEEVLNIKDWLPRQRRWIVASWTNTQLRSLQRTIPPSMVPRAFVAGRRCTLAPKGGVPSGVSRSGSGSGSGAEQEQGPEPSTRPNGTSVLLPTGSVQPTSCVRPSNKDDDDLPW